MLASHAYLIGVLGLGVVYALLFLARKDLARVILYAGGLYLVYGFVMFLVIRLLNSDSTKAINPGYWTPPTLLGINQRTGGYGLEDALFSFFAGGIAVGLYDFLFKLKVSKKPSKKLKKGHALLFALALSSLILVATPLNAIYFFISLQLCGAAAIVWQRKDLLLHSLAGGLVFMLLYGCLFTIFKILFPHFLPDYYHLQGTSRLLITGIPLEEFLYGLTLGMMWAPIYEYEHRVKDSKQRSLGLRKVFPAAGGARR
jgi:hypothetical protein